jgi:uncharacterized protein involved in exopolysaccharide biosynthesis
MGLDSKGTYEDEIDIRELVIKLWNRKWVILGVTLLVALAAGLISAFSTPHQFQATATVTLIQSILPGQSTYSNLNSGADLSQSQQSVSNSLNPFYSSKSPLPSDLVTWATSDSVLAQVLHVPNIAAQTDGLSLAALRSKMNASGIGASLIQLQVTQNDPQEAAALANAWASVMVNGLNNVYSVPESGLSLLKAQNDNAKKAWDQAESDLTAELKSNQTVILTAQLTGEKNNLSMYLQKKSLNDLFISDAQRLQTALGTLPPTAPLPTDIAVDILSLEQDSIGIQSPSAPQVQVSFPTVFGNNYMVSDAQASLKEFIASLTLQSTSLDANINQAENQILGTQVSAEQENYKLDQLTESRDSEKVTYESFSAQLQQMQAHKTSSPVASIFSQAVPPQSSTSRKVLTYAALAGALGFVLSMFGVLILDWWKRPSTNEK